MGLIDNGALLGGGVMIAGGMATPPGMHSMSWIMLGVGTFATTFGVMSKMQEGGGNATPKK